jgi:hypothetical protein
VRRWSGVGSITAVALIGIPIGAVNLESAVERFGMEARIVVTGAICRP